MKSLKLMTALIILLVSSCSAQTENLKTETVHILGNCAMCKSTIEKAGNLKKVATVDWDKDTKMAILKYDSLKTTKTEILKRIALVGYDNEAFLAPNDTYAELPGCCQYEREKKMEMSMTKSETIDNHAGHDMDDVEETTIAKDATISPQVQVEKEGLKTVFENYFKLKDALIQSNQKEVAVAAIALLNSINNVKMNELETDIHLVWMGVIKDLTADGSTISTSDVLEDQRMAFISLSENMYQLAKVVKVDNPIYFQHCPMANDGKGANWLSKEKEVKNPYYGSAMLSCGKIIETIK